MDSFLDDLLFGLIVLFFSLGGVLTLYILMALIRHWDEHRKRTGGKDPTRRWDDR